jgi:hypothetical protein
MATREELSKWQRNLQSAFPLLGRHFRRKAMAAIDAHGEDAAIIPVLAAALGFPDAEVAAWANAALLNLKRPAAIDALCALWAQKRDARLGAIIAQRQYVATGPAPARALSGLKAGAKAALASANAELALELVKALADKEPPIPQNAEAVLRELSNPQGIDALCALWAQKRDARLGAIIVERSYIAGAPPTLRVLTALKCGKRVAVEGANAVKAILALVADPDDTVRANATGALEKLTPGPAQDALCEEAIDNPSGPAAQLCVRTGKRFRDPEQACLFLFVTRQLEAYFKEDHEFQNLRMAYDRAGKTVQAQVWAVIRSGDNRVIGALGESPKRLSELTDEQRKTLLESTVRHKAWPKLLSICLELPLKHTLPFLPELRGAGWEPESPDLKAVLRGILADSDGAAVPVVKKAPAASSLFEQWVSRRLEGALAQANEAELQQRLASAPPPEAVAIVAALAAKAQPNSAATQTVRQSPHWLVRLAGRATGLSLDLAEDNVADPNYWVKEVASMAGVLEFWPNRATPADLEALAAVPAEAWTGKLGAARRILRTIMAYRVDVGEAEPLVVGPDELVPEIVPVDKDGN